VEVPETRLELERSRARAVAASDELRRHVVRDLHCGAQQSIVHTVILLKRALAAVQSGDDRGADMVADALGRAEQANRDLRELAYGILPSVLGHGGLHAGIDTLVARSSVPVSADVSRQRLPPPIEATAYFVVSEALANVHKHSGAGSAAIRASVEGSVLYIEVADDGVGGAELDGGTGLTGLSDRVAALDGQLRIESPPGGGTLIGVTLPLPDEQVSAAACG
jgi:signal transduction histidine kinase